MPYSVKRIGQTGDGHFRGLVSGLLFAFLGATSLPAISAPLDSSLSAMPELESKSGYLELATDLMNPALDVFRVKESDPKTAGTAAGDYTGFHLAGGVPVTEKLWISGSAWKRQLSTASDSYQYESLVLAGQFKVSDAAGYTPAMAVRTSIWGSRSAATESSSPVTVPGAILNSVRVSNPADWSTQIDLIGTWLLSNQKIFNASVGFGETRLSYGGLTGTTTRNGCNYNLQFNGNDIYGELARACESTGGVIQQFYDSSGAYGVDVATEIGWKGRFTQVGGHFVWLNEPWTYKAGYLLHRIKREAVDNILASRGKPFYETNHIVSLEASYRWKTDWRIFGRAHLSSNLFFNDLPVTYNTSTSERFRSKYSLFSFGIRKDF